MGEKIVAQFLAHEKIFNTSLGIFQTGIPYLRFLLSFLLALEMIDKIESQTRESLFSYFSIHSALSYGNLHTGKLYYARND